MHDASSESSQLQWDGEAYHRLSDMQYSLGMELLDRIELRGDEAVLDAGCGSGRLTAQLLQRLPRGHVIGVDLGSSMLQTAEHAVQATAQQQVEFLQADLQSYVSDTKVQGIYSNMALHFVHDHRRMFDNFARSLCPGGFLALQFGAAEQRGTEQPWLDMMSSGTYAPYLRSMAFDFKGATADETRQNLERAGFVDVQVDGIERQQAPEHMDKMRQYFMRHWLRQCLERLPKSLCAPFETDAQKFFMQAFAGPFHFIRVHAKAPSVH